MNNTATTTATEAFGQARAAATLEACALIECLTPRQREVLVLTCKGLTADQVAEQMGCSPKTVVHYKTALYQTLQVRNMVEAAVMATLAQVV